MRSTMLGLDYDAYSVSKKESMILRQAGLNAATVANFGFTMYLDWAKEKFNVPISFLTFVSNDSINETFPWGIEKNTHDVYYNSIHDDFSNDKHVKMMVILNATENHFPSLRPVLNTKFYVRVPLVVADMCIGFLTIIDNISCRSNFSEADCSEIKFIGKAITHLIESRREAFLTFQHEQNICNALVTHHVRSQAMIGEFQLDELEESLQLNCTDDIYNAPEHVVRENLVRDLRKCFKNIAHVFDYIKNDGVLAVEQIKSTNLISNIHCVSDLRSEVTSTESLATSVNQQSKLRVLVVDDTPSIVKVITQTLQKMNCLVTSVTNGEAGLEMLKTNHYDMALVDFLMPGMSGPDMLDAFMNWKKASQITLNDNMLVWGVSATACRHEQSLAIMAGMHIFSTKPLERSLIDHVQRVCNQHTILKDRLQALLQEESRHEQIIMSCQDDLTRYEIPVSTSLSTSESRGIPRHIRELIMNNMTERIFSNLENSNKSRVLSIRSVCSESTDSTNSSFHDSL